AEARGREASAPARKPRGRRAPRTPTSAVPGPPGWGLARKLLAPLAPLIRTSGAPARPVLERARRPRGRRARRIPTWEAPALLASAPARNAGYGRHGEFALGQH